MERDCEFIQLKDLITLEELMNIIQESYDDHTSMNKPSAQKSDDDKKLKQQIFVTTHSCNISAVAGLDNMFMMAYNRSSTPQDCINQSLEVQFRNEGDTKYKSEAKNI